MGDLVQLATFRAVRQLEEGLRRLNEQLVQRHDLEPSDFGWQVLKRAEDGVPVRWINLKYGAQIGYVPGRPDLTYLDYRHSNRAYELNATELVAAIESGTLPEPYATLDSLDEPLE